MKKSIPLLIFTVILLGCSNHSNIESTDHSQSLKVIDIRVHSNYEVVVNGESTSFYVLSNFLEEVDVDSSAHARVFFNDETAKGALSTIQGYIREWGLLTPSIRIFSEQEFEEHLSKHAYIDILSDESILFNGKEIHPEDLRVALPGSFEPDSTTIYVNVSQEYSSDEIFPELEVLGFSNISVNRIMHF